MNSIKASEYAIHFNAGCYKELNAFLRRSHFSKLFLITDSNTHEYCCPYFISKMTADLSVESIVIEAGEIHKSIDTCIGVWKTLSDRNADRKSLIINLGGGVTTDLGGFVASTYKRGIKYINVPTSLLAMVDASVGGKTGVDLDALKNQIGVINTPEMVLVDTHFLHTLPKDQMRSGFAEMLKHGLIQSNQYWDALKEISLDAIETMDKAIYDSILIKHGIVEEDPFEANLRKTLNYGHTLGHAIESYFLSAQDRITLLHGEAIAIGMILATYISREQLGFPKDQCEDIKSSILRTFPRVDFKESDFSPIIQLLKHDKKNEHGNVNFVLLEAIGKAQIDCQVDNDLILNAFKYYAS